MDRFVSNYTLRLDAKGRVSIPAPFRAVLARDGFEGLYCYPTLDQPAIDAGGNALMADIESADCALSRPIRTSANNSPVALYGTSETLKLDGEGRVILTDDSEGARRHHRCGRLCRSWTQVSDLGTGALPRATSPRPPRRFARASSD